jgi:hypothetical protein
LLEPASSAWHRSDERSFRKSTSSSKFFSTVDAQSANGRFQVRDRDGAMTEMGAQQTSQREPDNVGFPRFSEVRNVRNAT